MGTPLSLPRYAVQGGLMIDIYDITIKVDSLNLSIIQLSAYLPCVMNDASLHCKNARQHSALLMLHSHPHNIAV